MRTRTNHQSNVTRVQPRGNERYNVGESLPSIARRTILIGGNPCFMKLSWNSCERELRAFHLAIVLTQFQDLELAERVVKIGRVRSAALGFSISAVSCV